MHLEVDDKLISWAMVVFIFLFMFSFGVAISSIPWVLMGENEKTVLFWDGGGFVSHPSIPRYSLDP